MKQLSILFLLLIVFSNCATKNQIPVPITPIQATAIYKPSCFLEYIEKGNYGEINDSVSLGNETLIIEMLQQRTANLKIDGVLTTNNFMEAGEVEKEIDELFYQVNVYHDIKLISIPPKINQLMELQNHRYLLLIRQTGFFRRKGNYGSQVFLSIGLSILLGGNYTMVPNKAQSTMDVLILDSASNSIAFRKISTLLNRDPNDASTIDQHFHQIFKKFR